MYTHPLHVYREWCTVVLMREGGNKMIETITSLIEATAALITAIAALVVAIRTKRKR